MYALVDCNNFFVSCERLFRPELKSVPVAVLSNNDGCIVARSNEVKTLGVGMGVPHFKVKDILERHKATLFSANFRLYGDMSARVVQVLTAIAPEIEVYSVDESFLDISKLPVTDWEKWAKDAAAVVEKRTGIPVSVGVAPSKTLAKVAAEQAKKDTTLNGGHAIIPPGFTLGTPEAHKILAKSLQKATDWSWLEPHLLDFPVEDIWGVGRRLAPMLHGYGVDSAWDLVQAPDHWISKKMSVKGLITAKELRGVDCLGFGSERELAKSVSASRTFGSRLSKPHELESAVTSLAFRAGYRLRRKSGLANTMTIYLSGGKKANFRSKSARITFSYPLNDSGAMVATAIELLDSIDLGGNSYKKAGVILNDIVSTDTQQLPLVHQVTDQELDRTARKDKAIDDINTRWGSGTISYAVQHSSEDWISKRENVSPAYTTVWSDIPVIS